MQKKTCMIIPCYNEAYRLSIWDFTDFLDDYKYIDFCFVNDGSKDETLVVLQDIERSRKSRVKTINLTKNIGKAEAVRAGMNKMSGYKRYTYLGYIDADLATPLSEINYLFSSISAGADYKLIMGSRLRRLGASIERSAVRHYLGRIFATLASLLLGLSVYDTQCGAKLIERNLAIDVFEKPFVSRWLFDLEIIKRILIIHGKNYALKNIIEIPLMEWKEKGNSKIKITDIIKVPLELIRIYFKYR